MTPRIYRFLALAVLAVLLVLAYLIWGGAPEAADSAAVSSLSAPVPADMCGAAFFYA